MRTRRLESVLLSSLDRHAAVVLLGPRQVGKTTLAMRIAESREALYLDLERPSDAARLSDPELFLSRLNDRLVILDEVQRLPGLFGVLRGEIDRRRRTGEKSGQFLLLGSASDDLLNQSSESLAGRVRYLELAPFDLLEVGEDHQERLWVRGGFPESFDAPTPEGSVEWRASFIRTYLERDIPALGSRIPAETLRRFWTMLAHGQGGVFNASRLASGLGVSGQTVTRYVDILSDLMLVRRLEPWSANVGKRLTRSPKIYVRDSGILHSLLGIGEIESLLGHPVVGGSWEGFVIENLVNLAPPGATPWFYRTSAGAEVDLLLLMPDGVTLWGIEIKRSSVPKASRGFRNACDDLGVARRIIVAPVRERYEMEGEVEVVPVGEVMGEMGVGY